MSKRSDQRFWEWVNELGRFMGGRCAKAQTDDERFALGVFLAVQQVRGKLPPLQDGKGVADTFEPITVTGFNHGLAVMGRVRVSGRKPPRIQFERLLQDMIAEHTGEW